MGVLSEGTYVSANREEALRLVDEFEKRSSTSAFPSADKSQLIEGLRARIIDPKIINQNHTMLCGPAAFVYSMASQDPVAYARFIIDLYEKGRATVGKMTVSPSGALMRYSVPAGEIHVADWIPLASIRNSKGSVVFFDKYDSVDEELPAMTLPSHLHSWIDEVGYTKVVDRTHVFGMSAEEGKKSLSDAIIYDREGYRVFLLIRASLVQGESDGKKGKKAAKKGSSLPFPDHWVVLEEGDLADGIFWMRIYSWGQFYSIPPDATWTLDDVVTKYYGFIAGKY
ncbi:MAG: hypothetical protein HUU21_12470 [Polyangiaceae bacterium]|nr:hypothetical protein [Polyangiaceae bacterium]